MAQRGFPDEEEQIFSPLAVGPRNGGGGFPDEPDPLRTTFGRALEQQPDQASRIFNLRLKTGLPPVVIERNLEAVERNVAAAGFDADRYRRESPLLAKWLEENPELAAVAQDDLEPLSGIERALQVGTRAARALTTGPMALSAGVWGTVRAGAEWAGAEDLAEFARGSAAVAEHLRTRLRGDRAGAEGFEAAAYSGLESLSLMATALPAAAVGGTPALLAVMGGTTAGQSYTQAREEGRGVTRASAFALGQGAIEAATELIPARWFLADLAQNAGFWRALKHQAFGEIPGEQIATALQDLNEWALVRQDGTFVDYLRERPSAAADTLVATIVAVGGQAALVRGLERMGGKPASAQVLEELHEAAAASKTRERSPEALSAFVDRITAEGLTHVYAPAVAFTEYFQKQGEDPEQLATELTGNPDALRLARATNGDLAIPTSTYVSRIVGSGHEPFFVEELRLTPDSQNARETKESIAAEAEAVVAFEAPADPSAAAREQVYRALVETLTASNRYTPQEVDYQARLYASVFGVLGTREGVEPAQLLERSFAGVVAEGRPSDVSIEIDTGGESPGGVPASAARAGETPQQREVRRAGHLQALTAVLTREAQLLDPNVDAGVIRAELDRRLELAEEKHAAESESGEGQDLLRAMAGYGGVWWEKNTGALKGEIEFYAKENRDIRSVTRSGRVRHLRGRATWRGVPGVFNEEGLTPDGMVEALRQDQRFQHIEDINGLLDAIDRAMQSEADVDALPGTDELEALGIQRGTRWWAAESEAVDEGALYGPLQQAAPPANERGETAYFIGWQESGLSDVAAIPLYNVIGGERSGTTLSPAELDELGIPYLPAAEEGDASFNVEEFEQAAFHGSPHIFDAFSLQAIGTGEGAQAYGWGLYFASKREVADEYRKRLAGAPRDKRLSFDGRDVWGPGGLWGLVEDAIVARGGTGDVAVGGDRVHEDHFDPSVDVARVRRGLLELHPRAYYSPVGEAGIARLRDNLTKTVENLTRGIATEGREGYSTGDVRRDRHDLQAAQDALYVLDTFGGKLTIAPPEQPGRTYKVEIPEDEDYLDWDKPASQQSAKVRAALRALGVEWTAFKHKTPKQWLAWFESKVADQLWREDIGIRESLQEGYQLAINNQREAFNRWQEQHQGLVNRSGGMVDPTGERVYQELSQRLSREVSIRSSVGPYSGMQASAEAASKALAQHGIAGLRYLDGFSRRAGEGSYNYVVFDDRLVSIVEFYQRGDELTEDRLWEWVEQMRADVGANLEQFNVELIGDDIVLELLVVGGGARSAGIGSMVMRELTALADRYGKRILLTLARPSQGWGTSSVGRLRRFYARFDFTPHEPTLDEPWEMERAPRAAGETEFRQEAPREARRRWLENRIRTARAEGREDFEANRLLQDLLDEEADEQLRDRAARGETEFEQDPTKGTFNPSTRVIRLLKNADRSTFLHESAHLFLEVMSDLAAAPGASAQLQTDMQTLLGWVRFEGDLAAWRALSHEQRRDHHEEFARGFEKYLGEGKAPTPELQPLFSRFRAWLLGVYRSLRRLNVELTPEVRAVMDRMLATDEAIAAAEADAGVVPLFTDAAAAGVPPAEFEGYREQLQAASDQARARLQARLVRELEREQEAWWQEQRTAVRAEVAAEIYERPVYRALAAMRGTLPDGSPLPEGTPATPLSKDFLVAQFGRSILRKLPRPYVYSADSGLPPDTVAQIYGFRDGEALIGAILSAPPMDEAIDAITDERMLERHGDLLRDPDALVEQARAAIAGEHRDTVIRAELRMLNKLRAAAAPSVRGATSEQRAEERAGQRAGAARLRAEMPDQATLDRLAKAQIAGMRLRDIRPDRFFASARRHSRTATQAAAAQKFEEAVAAKQQELVNLALYREALAAREAVDEARTSFDKMFKPDAPMAKRRNMDYVQGARAIAATYFWPERRLASALEALDVIKRHTEEDEFEILQERIRAVTAAGTDLQALTFDDFTFMRETVDGLWAQSLREQQMLVEGQLVDRNEAAAALDTRLDELGTPESQFFRTDTERSLTVLGFRAALRRVEHWVDYVDGKNPLGAFRRFIWNPIAEATAQYRIERGLYLQKFLELLKPIEASLTPGRIPAPELGYTFESRAALLHALLHSGNESNFQKLLRGYRWGQLLADGTVDTSRWRAFLQRAHREGLIRKADWDFVQSVWDLNEELKAPAQKAHREMYGTYFSEITAWPVETPFGTYRGGYVPAMVDPLRVAKQEAYSEKSLTDGDNAFMFPTTGRGFTRSRVESYARPFALDLRLLPGHHDKVLRFIHLEPRVRDVGRLLRTHRVRERLDAYDPAVINEMLMPWLQRAATQRVSQAPRGRAARGIDAVFRTLRARTGLNIMAGHVINTLQQFTGISVAALRVQPRYLRNALWRYIRDHKAAVEFVSESDPFMRTRTTAAAIETQRTIEDLLLNPSKYQQVREFGARHGYFLQQTTQNIVDHVAWLGAYEQATERGALHADAVREAAATVRMTQGSFAPEDASRVESQSAFARMFVMFYGYFNMLANINGNELALVARDMGLRKGAGRALYVYTFGFLLTAVMGEAILRALNGDWDDDDDDGYLDEVMSLFFGSQLRQLAAMVPGGQVAAAVFNRFNDRTYDDRVSTSPAISFLESATRAPYSLYRAMLDEGSKKQAVRDSLDAIGLLTGLPVGAVKRPAGYLADIVDEREEPEGVGDLVRGLVSGRSQAER